MDCDQSDPPRAKPKPRKRVPKPPPVPKFTVGQVVKTRAVVRVRCAGPRNRKFLHLLPGCEWQVIAVVPPEPGERRQVKYRLKTVQAEHVVRRKEFQLRAMS